MNAIKPVTLEMSFVDLLGINSETMSEETRKSRWATWLDLAARHDITLYHAWIDDSACDGCLHQRYAWCKRQQLPCTVNPILSFRSGLPGMACMGAGKERSEPDLPGIPQ